MDNKTLYRPIGDKMVAGVCSGIAAYFGLEKSTVRVVTFLLIAFGGLSLWAYIALWAITPSR